MRSILLALLLGCGVDTADPAAECVADAFHACASIGFDRNEYCHLVFSQRCSEDLEAAAQAFCRAHPEVPHDEECHPKWR